MSNQELYDNNETSIVFNYEILQILTIWESYLAEHDLLKMQ